MSTTQPAETQTVLDADRRWRECLAATFDAWRRLDDWLFDYLDTKEPLTSRTEGLARHRQRMADALDLLEREYVMRATRGPG